MQLLQTNINTVHKAVMDNHVGFKECSSVVPDSRLKEKFENISIKRLNMAKQLEIRGGATRKRRGSLSGSLNRAWSKIRLSFDSDNAVQHWLEGMVQAEVRLKKVYNTALLSGGVDSALNALVVTHLRIINSDLSELRIISGEVKYLTKWETKIQTPGEKIKDSLHMTGENIKEKMHTTGENLSAKLSATGSVLNSKLIATGATIQDKISTTGSTVKDTVNHLTLTKNDQSAPVNVDQPTTGQNIKEKLHETGEAIKEKLGVGQQNTVNQ